MGCDVCIGGDVDYDGYPEFYIEAWPKARKPHRCVECREEIKRGESYQSASGKFDGEIFREKTCAACADIRNVYSCGSSPAFGAMWNEFEENVFDHLQMAGECWDSLTAPAKAKLLDKWREWKGLTK